MTHGHRLLAFALGVWIGTSLIAAVLLPTSPVAGVLVAVCGGMAFGVVAAKRADPRKVRVRRRRGSSRRSQETV